ncbi:hypothetical protein CJU89_3743 [Yarrowia sp. B02]|nr:hypothetical protein CJU89_3743 [Yarrowia sp. B02]
MILSLLFTLAVAQVQLTNPINSVDVSVKNSDSSVGDLWDLWQMNLGFSIDSPIQTGDWFDITVNGDVLAGYTSGGLTPYTYDFDIVDSSGAVVFHVADTETQWTLRATAETPVDTFFAGNITLEFYIQLANVSGPFTVSIGDVSGSGSINPISQVDSNFRLIPLRYGDFVLFGSALRILPDTNYIITHTLGDGLRWDPNNNEAAVNILDVNGDTVDLLVSGAGSDSLIIYQIAPFPQDLAPLVADFQLLASVIGDVSEYCATVNSNAEVLYEACIQAGLGVLGVAGGTGIVEIEAVTSSETSTEAATSTSEASTTSGVTSEGTSEVTTDTPAPTTSDVTTSDSFITTPTTGTGRGDGDEEETATSTDAMTTPVSSNSTTPLSSSFVSFSNSTLTSISSTANPIVTSIASTANPSVTSIASISNPTVTSITSTIHTTITTTQTVSYCESMTCGKTTVTITTVVPVTHTITTCPTVIEGKTVTVVVPCEVTESKKTVTKATDKYTSKKTEVVSTTKKYTSHATAKTKTPTTSQAMISSTPTPTTPTTSTTSLATITSGDRKLTLTQTITGTINLSSGTTASQAATTPETIHQANSASSLRAGILLVLSVVVLLF